MASNQVAMARRIGAWSAFLFAAANLWFYAAFIPYGPEWNAPWPGIAAYAAAFQAPPFLAWVIPSFVIAPLFLTMMACLHYSAAEDKRFWTLLALAFSIAYAAVLTPLYYMYMTVVPYHLANGSTEGLSLWLFAYDYPHNLFGALEAVGYGFASASAICAARAFGRGKLEQWVRWTFVGLGVCTLGLFINPLYALPTILGMVLGLGGGLFLVLAPVLLAFRLRRPETGGVKAFS